MWLGKAANLLSKPVNPFSRMINNIGAAVLVAMMVLTTADVVLRYIFNRPITGSLELTEFMMAVVVAFGLAYTAVRKEHIIVDAVLSHLTPRTQGVVNAITSLLCLGIFGLITWRSIYQAESLRFSGSTSSALYIPTYPFVYVVAFGSAILCLVFIQNLLEHLARVVKGVRVWVWVGLLLVIIVVVALFSVPAWGGWLKATISPTTAGFIGIAVLIAMLFSGMPVGAVMIMVGFLGLAFIANLGPALISIGTSPNTTASSYGLSVIPLFTLMGLFCYYSGLTSGLYSVAYKWLGHMPGGLAMATIGASAGFAAVSGSSVACVATIGTVALPEMKKYRYDASLATACLATGGCLGILIPPSVILAIYGILTEQSIGKLFLAGFIPGILEAILFIVTIYIQCKRNPLMGPPGERSSLIEKVVSLKNAWSTVLLFVLVIGGLYAGVFTATEAAGVGAFGAFVIALSHRGLKWKDFVDSLIETTKTTAMVFIILIGADIFGYFMALARLPTTMSDYIGALTLNRYFIIIGIILLYLFLGMIISSIAMIVLTIPIFFPIITTLGFDPIWFGIIIVMVVEMGQLTPPVAINVFVIHGIAKDVPMYTTFRGIWPFLYAQLVLVALLIAFPQIATFVPNMMK